MANPAATGRGISRTDATRARDLAPTAFRRRSFSGISWRQKVVDSSSRSTGMRRLCFSARGAWRSGGKGGRGESPAQKYGAVCADRLPQKLDRPCQRRFHWCANYGSNQTRVAAAPIRGLENDSCRPLAAPVLELKRWGATLLSSRVKFAGIFVFRAQRVNPKVFRNDCWQGCTTA